MKKIKIIGISLLLLITASTALFADEEFDKEKFLKTMEKIEGEVGRKVSDASAKQKAQTQPVVAPSVAVAPNESIAENKSYFLKKGDGLKIEVYKERDLSGDFDINESGTISFPLISSVDAAGKTEDQLAEEIAKRLKRYLKDPKVSVRKDLRRSGLIKDQLTTFSVLGEVKKSGEYEMKEGITLTSAIAISGGLTPIAGDEAKIVRVADGNRDIKNYNIKGISEGLVEDPLILQGDKIIISQKQSYVTGAAILGKVQKPGIYDAEEGMTLIRLIAQAGGLSVTADSRKIRLVRNEDDKILIKNYDLNKILSGQIADPIILGGDKVYIEESFF
ncbi:MAG: SLBB domain-containing protein [Candidatus Omnitrophica bacterium]|nr:SLBB domain-containing protein [Candidatus Omnitrophota bacterium]